VTEQVNPIFSNLIEFKKHPSPYILLGDSRMKNMDLQKIKTLSGESYSNLAYGGASIIEIQKTFWFAARTTKLKKVFIGMNFELYNSLNNRDLVTKTLDFLDNPVQYFINLSTWESIYHILRTKLSGKKPIINKPDMSKQSFWTYQLNVTAKRYYESYSFPYAYHNSLLEIALYCEKENIKLCFIIFPTHSDLRNKISEYGLLDWNERFKQEMYSFTQTLDFDQDNFFSKDSSYFKDPFHYNETYGEMLICSIWESSKKITGEWIKNTSPSLKNPPKLIISGTTIIYEGYPNQSTQPNKTTIDYFIASDNGTAMNLFSNGNINYKLQYTQDSLTLLNLTNSISMGFHRLK
jgi:hypothetical protein